MGEAGRATQWLALVSILLLGMKESPPREERFMKIKSGLGLFLGSALFLSAVIPALAQSTGDVSSPPAQPPAVAAEAKTATLPDAGKVIQTKEFTLESAKVWVDTGISLESGQKIVVTSS